MGFFKSIISRRDSDGSLNSRLQELIDMSLEEASSMLEREKKCVEIVFFFDKSYSCIGTEKITIDGFNRVIENEVNNGFLGDIVSVVLFNHESDTVYDRLPIENLGGIDYVAKGGTALYDTLYQKITYIEGRQKNDEVKPQNTIVIIMTDGFDEHSFHYNLADVRDLIMRKSADGWKFLFLGTMLNSKDVAEELGISRENAEYYSTGNLKYNFDAIESAIAGVREYGELQDGWSYSIIKHRLPKN